jgi:hypothetical protein
MAMPWNLGPSVNQYKSADCWRTWFFEECDKNQRFGITEAHVPRITISAVGFSPYQEGTTVYLEDAPYFGASKKSHRICGPYKVFGLVKLPENMVRVFPEGGPAIVYKDLRPELGPWLDSPPKTRIIDGVRAQYQQNASGFHYFPYRFAVGRSTDFGVEFFRHTKYCSLCK